MKKKVLIVAGARPNFMKAAPVYKALKRHSEFFEPLLVHTGQHYDKNMSWEVMRDLNQTRNMTFVFSTHDEKIMERATRLIHLRDGKVELDELK